MDGPYTKINGSLIAAKGSVNRGASYGFVDEGVKNRTTYYYKLVDVNIYGIATLHGPKVAKPRLIYRLIK